MLVQIRDRKALATLPLVNLRSYLNSRGWQDTGPWGNRPATVFVREEDGNTRELLLPLRDTIADYAESVAESIAVLAEVEKRSQLDVFHEISAAGADVIRLRSANGLAEKPLSLRQSAGLLNDAYGMLAAAARSAESPQAAYRGKISSEVTEYLDNIVPLTGQPRGYTLTLHSPVPVGIGQQDFGDDFHAPFPRRVTYKLAQGLEHTSSALAEAVAGDSLEPFEKVVQYGVSANLCDSIAALAKNGEGIEINLTWADARPSNAPDFHFPFSLNSSPILSEVAKSLRRNEPSFNEQIIAQVVELERRPDEFDGRATILSTRDERLIRLRVEFDQSVYDMVIQAFQEHKSISLDGDIHPAGARHELHNPRNLSLLNDG